MTQTPKNAPLSLQPYRGTRDFFPPEQRFRQWLFMRLRGTLQRFGYEEYDGPLLEPLELYASKSSQEIVSEQLYNLVDRGERALAIRPEMTPTLARMVASRARELPRPIRWFSIPRCMRYERPQRGRLREFEQLNVDLLGGLSLDEDVEIILVAVALLHELGAQAAQFEVKLNHRGLVNRVLKDVANLDQTQSAPVLRLLDKRDKLSAEAFKEQWDTLGLPASALAGMETFLAAKEPGEVRHLISGACPELDALERLFQALREVCPLPGALRFAPDVMRGFDYYTGLVFEIFDAHPENRRALFGGGRYDNLVGSLCSEALAGIGFGVSDVSLENFLRTHDLVPSLGGGVDLCVLRFSEADRASALQLAGLLRGAGLAVQAPLTAAKFGKQIQSAERAGALAVAFRGEDELRSGSFAVKWLGNGTQSNFPLTAEGAAQATSALHQLKAL